MFGLLRLSGLLSSVQILQECGISTRVPEIKILRDSKTLQKYGTASRITELKIFKCRDRAAGHILFTDLARVCQTCSEQTTKAMNLSKIMEKAIETSLKVNFVNWAAFEQLKTIIKDA